MKKILLFLLFNVNLIYSQQSQSNKDLIVKWLTRENLPNSMHHLELEQNVTCINDNENCCLWYKISDNKLIDQYGKTFKQQYLYKITSKQCNLLITEYNEKTHQQLDIYRPVISAPSSSRQQPISLTYTLVYVKSFEFKKKQLNSTSFEASCEVIITIAVSDDENLNERINNELFNNIELEIDEIVKDETNTNSKARLSQNEPKHNKQPIFRNIASKIESWTNRQRRSNTVRYLNDVFISNKIDYKTLKSNKSNKYKCKLVLYEQNTKKISFSKSLNLTIDGGSNITTNLRSEYSGSNTQATVRQTDVKTTATTTKIQYLNVENWKPEDVNNWLIKTRIDTRILLVLKNLNGKHLKRLRVLSKEAPTYFYDTISQSNKIDLFSVLSFVEEFEKLF